MHIIKFCSVQNNTFTLDYYDPYKYTVLYESNNLLGYKKTKITP